ncbi:hypothetical protein BVRB_4g086310 isoform B [Beta vulgaris subsp. vulgaris]|nr:hypothetical protein BVRB_4g086310 isoform B [Beta vulgaris subsp. vulgaris]
MKYCGIITLAIWRIGKTDTYPNPLQDNPAYSVVKIHREVFISGVQDQGRRCTLILVQLMRTSSVKLKSKLS